MESFGHGTIRYYMVGVGKLSVYLDPSSRGASNAERVDSKQEAMHIVLAKRSGERDRCNRCPL